MVLCHRTFIIFLHIHLDFSLFSISPSMCSVSITSSFKCFNPIQTESILKSIKSKSINHDIIFTKANKSNTVIAINKKDYIEKTLHIYPD